MANLKSKELTKAEEFIVKCKFDEAFKLLNNIEQQVGLTLEDTVLSNLLKSRILIQQGKYEDVINLAERTHKESLGLGKHILTVDPLLLMAEALLWINRMDEAIEKIKLAEEFLNKISQEKLRDYMQREASIAFLKGRFYVRKTSPEIDRALENLERSLELRKQIGNELDVANSLLILGIIIALHKLKPDRGLDLMKQALALGKKIDNKYLIASALRMIFLFYYNKAELDLSLMYAEQSLTLYKEIDNKSRIAPLLSIIGDIYRLRSDYKRASEYMEQSLTVNEEIGGSYQEPLVISNLIALHLEMGNLEIAQQYFKRLEQLNNQVESEWVNYNYRFSKATLLKQSSRIKSLAEAEEILKEIIEEEGPWTNYALLEICDLLLVELGMTNDVEILDEIKLYINQLKNYAENFKSFWLLAETCLLQAKLALISLNLEKAQRLLTQGQKIAEKYGLSLLARKISNEHDKLLKQLSMWENLKESKASLNERMELAQLNEQMENMIRKRAIEVPELSDEEPVFILIVSEGGRPIFSQSFIEDQKFEDHLLGGFLSAINSFIGEMFSEGLDRVSFGEHTLLMTPVPPFFVCYVFKGQSYSAQQRIRYFIDKIQNDEPVWQTFNKFNQVNREIQLKDIPSLEPLINEIFIRKTIHLNGLA